MSRRSKLNPDGLRLTPDEMKARTAHIFSERELGKTYQEIADGLPDAGFKYRVSKMRIMDMIEKYRPDLMGHMGHLKEGR